MGRYSPGGRLHLIGKEEDNEENKQKDEDVKNIIWFFGIFTGFICLMIVMNALFNK